MARAHKITTKWPISPKGTVYKRRAEPLARRMRAAQAKGKKPGRSLSRKYMVAARGVLSYKKRK